MARILFALLVLLVFYGCKSKNTANTLPQVLPIEGDAGKGLACVIELDGRRVAATPAHVLLLAGNNVRLDSRPVTRAQISKLRDLALLELSAQGEAIPEEWRFHFREKPGDVGGFPFNPALQSGRYRFAPGDSGCPVVSDGRRGLFAGRDIEKKLYLATGLDDLGKEEWESVELAELNRDLLFLHKIDREWRAFADFLRSNPSAEAAQNHFKTMTDPAGYRPACSFSTKVLQSRIQLYQSFQARME